MKVIDQNTLIPVGFTLILSGLIAWGTRLYYLNEVAHKQIHELRAVQEENHRSYVRKINDIQDMLIGINRSLGQIEGMIERENPPPRRPRRGMEE